MCYNEAFHIHIYIINEYDIVFYKRQEDIFINIL